MTNEILQRLLEINIGGSIAIIFVLLCRFLLKDRYKIFSYVMWSVILFRFLCPVSIEFELSCVGLFSEPIKDIALTQQKTQEDLEDLIGEIEPDNIVISQTTPSDTTVHIGEVVFNEPQITVKKLNIPFTVWLIGMSAMLCYGIYCFIKLKIRLIGAVNLKENIYIADNIPSPFVVGLIFPKIYLPSYIGEEESQYIICHEKHHIKRLDHIVKILAFTALCIHWFNPLVWLAFFLSTKDMEMSCDEAVIRKLGENIKADYAKSLLDLSTGKMFSSPALLAFGEGNTKSRIKNIAKIEKKNLIIIIFAVLFVIAVTVSLIFDPIKKQTELLGANYHIDQVIYNNGEDYSPPVQFCISADYRLYSKNTGNDAWAFLGKLERKNVSKEEFERYFSDKSAWIKRYSLKEITDSYILRLGNDDFYIAVQTSDGDTLLAYGWEDVSEKGDQYSDDTYIKTMYLLESEFSKNTFNVNFFERSLKYTIGKNIDCFYYYENDKHPGFAVVGFKAGNGSRATMTDLGFAVFSFAENVGYKLIEWHNYSGAAVNGERIYTCEHPAVFSINGVSNFMNSYDVVLYTAPELHKITREYKYDGKSDVIISDITDGHIGMTLFHRSNRDAAVEVKQYYYDEFGNCFGSEDVTVASKFTDISGKSYVSWRSIYITPISSFMPINGDSGYRYLIGEDSFSIIGKTNNNINTFNDVRYEWQKLPWTKDEWNEMFFMEIPEELSNTDNILWQPISDDYFLLDCNGKMYISRYIYEPIPQRTTIWDIYELIPEEKVGFAEWIYEPYQSSKLPYLQFKFDIPNATYVTAICFNGEISNECINSEILNKNEIEVYPTVDKSTALYWAPGKQIISTDLISEIHFTVYNKNDVIHNGIIYITPGADRGSYTATVGGHGLCIKNSNDGEGAIISILKE